MTSDDIYIVSSDWVEQWTGDQLSAVRDYVEAIFGSSYEYYEYRGYDCSEARNNYNTIGELQDWWTQEPFTSYDRNLLLADANEWGGGGESEYPSAGGHAAVAGIYSGVVYIADPSTDADLIGDSASYGYSYAKQVATCVHEMGHLFGCFHKDGYGDAHGSTNYTTLMATGQFPNLHQEYNNCNDYMTHNGVNGTRYVQGFTECAVDNRSFNHSPVDYSSSEVDSL